MQRGVPIASVRADRPGFRAWAHHALDKARQLGFARQDVEAMLLERHRDRRRNKDEAAWQIQRGYLPLVISC